MSIEKVMNMKKGMEKPLTAMILAAGKGTRMRPLTDTRPKPLLDVSGQPLIEWHLQKLRLAGISRVVVNCAYLAEKVEDYFANRPLDGLEIIVINEQGEPLETAGGIVNAMEYLGETPFILINGDVWIDMDYRVLAAQLGAQSQSLSCASQHVDQALPTMGCLFLVENPDHNPSGDFVLTSDEQLLNQRQPKEQSLEGISSQSYTFSGVSVLSPELFEGLTANAGALGPHLRKWIDQGLLSACLYDGFWLDVGTPERLAQLEERVSQDLH